MFKMKFVFLLVLIQIDLFNSEECSQVVSAIWKDYHDEILRKLEIFTKITNNSMMAYEEKLNSEIKNLNMTLNLTREKYVNDFVKTNERIDENKLEISANFQKLLPIGFIYTQFPEQYSASEIWPNFEWEEITSKYAGLFFRAEGGDSKKFNEKLKQDSNQIKISRFIISGREITGHTGASTNKSIELIEGENIIWNKDDFPITKIQLSLNSNEIRPINKAIKIWRRIN